MVTRFIFNHALMGEANTYMTEQQETAAEQSAAPGTSAPVSAHEASAAADASAAVLQDSAAVDDSATNTEEGAPKKKRRRRRGGKRHAAKRAAQNAAEGEASGEAEGGAESAPTEKSEQPREEARSREDGDRPKRRRRKRNRRGPEEEHARDESDVDPGAEPGRDGKAIDPDTVDITGHPFKELGLSDLVVKGVAVAGFEKPTDIQAELIPHVLNGHDVIGQARTGTGKTAAFGLPLFDSLDPAISMQALVLTPTRELALQVAAEINGLSRFTPIKAVGIIGGASMTKQRAAVESGAQIMVGTPGRVMDLHGRGMIHFKDVKLAMLDEVDRMLDIGFRDDIRKILQIIKRENQQEHGVQTVFVSATMTQDIERLARTFMKEDAKKIMTVEGALTVQRVDQSYLTVEPWDKRALLLKLLQRQKPETVIVFCRTKRTVGKVTAYLRTKNLDAHEIHGDMAQGKRNRIIKEMKEKRIDILIASDLAARGLDIDHITHVVNYDLPEDPDIYVHRIGRTARAGRRGVAWSFVTPEEGQRLTDVEKLTGAMIEHWDYPDFKPGPVPQDIREVRDQDAKREAKKTDPESRTLKSDVEEMTDEQKAAAFPGGIVPAASKRKASLGSRFRRRGR